MIISYRPRLEMGSIFLARSRVGLTFYLIHDRVYAVLQPIRRAGL